MYWLCLILLASGLRVAELVDPTDLEKLDFMGVMNAFGWHGEDHTVQTEDGYILKLYRLLSPGIREKAEFRPPVLMMSGLFSLPEIWILQGPSKDLAFMLVDAGFDVWLGNIRGNTPGKGHVSLNSTEDIFWEFSWHEMGYYDVPALIDHILDRTGAQQVSYIGHSMGSTMFFVTAATRPEYNAKVHTFIALAPVVYMTGPYNPLLKKAGQRSLQIYNSAKKNHIKTAIPESTQRYLQNLYKSGPRGKQICIWLAYYFAGRTPSKHFDTTILPLMITHTSGSNPRTVLHYAQNIYSGRFQRFSLGPKENLRLYGKVDPPDYDLSHATVPTALYYTHNDALSFEVDVLKLAKALPNVIRIYKVPEETFNHLDFIWAKDAYDLVYRDIITLMIKRS